MTVKYNILLLFTLLSFSVCLVAQETGNEWKDEAVFRVNKEPAHAWFIPYQNVAIAKKKDPLKSEFYQLLESR